MKERGPSSLYCGTKIALLAIKRYLCPVKFYGWQGVSVICLLLFVICNWLIEMRALLPVYCRPLGYFIIALALFLPFIFLLWGKVTDANLLFYKECSKLLMMMGALMLFFALTKNATSPRAMPSFWPFFLSSAVCSTGWRRVTSFRSILLLFSYFLYWMCFAWNLV